MPSQTKCPKTKPLKKNNKSTSHTVKAKFSVPKSTLYKINDKNQEMETAYELPTIEEEKPES